VLFLILQTILEKKKYGKALNVLKELKYQKEPTQKILITLYNHFKKLYFTKKAIELGKKDFIQILNLKPNQEFLVSKYKAQANSFEIIDLKNLLLSLSDLDYQSKSGNIDLDIGLESILCKYCS